MGLKWFRARLSMEKEATKVPEMTGMYRRILYSEHIESAIEKEEVSTTHFSNNSMASDDNETIQYDHSKADLTSQLSSSITDSEEIMIKDNEKEPQINNYAVENAEPSAFIKDLNVKEQSTCDEESNKITKDQNDMSGTKSPICSDNELVI